MATTDPNILRPQPRRMFTTSPAPSEPTSPAPGSEYDYDADSPRISSNTFFNVSRPRSVLNLTASTLAGIYAPDDDSSLFGVTPLHTGGATTPAYPPTPGANWRNDPLVTESDREKDRMAPVIGALEQPLLRRKPKAISSPTSPLYIRFLRGFVRAALLFGLGAAYGSLVTHLHDARNLAPVKIEGLHRESVSYTIFWGFAGIILGTALPIVDAIWAGEGPEEIKLRERAQKATATGNSDEKSGNTLSEGAGLGAEWNPMVRSIGAFVGIGFAIRKLPWQSTLQASVTLALVNPCLWYMIDRTVPGFTLASVVGVLGTSVLLGTNVVPMPDIRAGSRVPGTSNGSVVVDEGALPLGIEQGTLAVWVWIASVLFCSCLCFGNIGRRLALGINGRRG